MRSEHRFPRLPGESFPARMMRVNGAGVKAGLFRPATEDREIDGGEEINRGTQAVEPRDCVRVPLPAPRPPPPPLWENGAVRRRAVPGGG
ncbi:MAG: hypothetical protein AVDCRST_MAG18-5062 [uncultured Thermomicrobiales bacterium]|uniref:Uncharacterized protein n=1 Tax=uncultured Thermomicrobiales bacterium TaxID=1645740 RepID=A0A6N3IPI7_9BACT|nr:MAG: hypothetical protein AVDCRST_MAG18-5062 [uncultured Thermomicrobiales bacterium]